MELFSNLILGFQTAVTPVNLLYCFIGVLVGTLVGVLPGIGSMATMAMLLPLTFKLEPVGALIMLAGIFYGTKYGGSTTAIMVKLPGEAASVVTCLDGYEMARKGRAGPALAIAAIGSFIAGTVGTLIMALFGPPLTEMALKFGAPEYFSLMVMGLVGSAVLAHGSLLKALGMIVLGLLLGIVGSDVNSGIERFTFGAPALADGISFIVVAMGLFGFAEIVSNLESGREQDTRDLLAKKVTNLMPRWQDFKDSSGAIARGTALGAFFGVLPGAGPTISSFASYALEKKLSKEPEKFGTGVIQGVAGPESANNGSAQCEFIPTLTLGIPGSASMAMVLGALTAHGISPGPQVMTLRPDLFWGLVASMWIGNLMLLVLNLPLIGIWIKLLTVPYRYLFPSISVFMVIGVYTVNNLDFDLYLTVLFGLIGYVMIKLKFEPAPLMLALVLGPMVEENLRRSMLLSEGDPTIFFTHPISAGFLAATVLFVVLMVAPDLRRKRDRALAERS
jgi:putative tricarboxylic transport membrane protein